METIIRPQSEVAVLARADVAVIGGGISGCAAAVAAAREGASTLLMEKNGMLGGVATAGLMANIGNLFLTADEQHVIRGIAQEFIQKLTARRGASPMWKSRDVAGVVMDPEKFKVILTEMVQEAGVELLLHTRLAEVIKEGREVTALLVTTRDGLRAVLADVVIDATGENDLLALAGVPMVWEGGSASLEFRMTGVDLEEFYQYFRENPDHFPQRQDMVLDFAQFQRAWCEHGVFFFPHGGGQKCELIQSKMLESGYPSKKGMAYGLDAFGMYGLRGWDTVVINSNFYRVKDLTTELISRMEVDARYRCFEAASFLRNNIPGFRKAYLVDTAAEIGIRTSRRIQGSFELTSRELCSTGDFFFADSIGRVPCRRDRVDEAFFWNSVCEVPYRILVPPDIENLLVASGKGVSTSPVGLLRGMSTCSLLGQGAGTAAALAQKEGVPVGEIPVKRLQRSLLDQSVFLGDEDRLAELGLCN